MDQDAAPSITDAQQDAEDTEAEQAPSPTPSQVERWTSEALQDAEDTARASLATSIKREQTRLQLFTINLRTLTKWYSDRGKAMDLRMLQQAIPSANWRGIRGPMPIG
ncbi:hypothetical protein PFLUV_G00015210 [Perca fluviatilis]|uniref:Uncharacterized protein n=1 Tax=Perca fluviatilis TaxID=8168 RepID=A0A6A5FDL3_PERFL|nr:hypothetical protein PFLUV_G00015210 [Perca fluviatilis]